MTSLPVPESGTLTTKETYEVFGDFERGGPVIRIAKYSGDLVLLGEGETMLQSLIPTLIEVVI